MSACFWFVFSLLCVVAAYRLLRWSAAAVGVALLDGRILALMFLDVKPHFDFFYFFEWNTKKIQIFQWKI